MQTRRGPEVPGELKQGADLLDCGIPLAILGRLLGLDQAYFALAAFRELREQIPDPLVTGPLEGIAVL
jgi:hypothetical protein